MKDFRTVIWDKVSKTNPTFTKDKKGGGRTMTAINPHYQLAMATSLFGPFGSQTFRRYDEKFTPFIVDEENTLMLYNAKLHIEFEGYDINIELHSDAKVKYFVKKGEYFKVEEDFMKKAATDALTKALSWLGFNADVFYGWYDDKEYVKDVEDIYSGDNYFGIIDGGIFNDEQKGSREINEVNTESNGSASGTRNRNQGDSRDSNTSSGSTGKRGRSKRN